MGGFAASDSSRRSENRRSRSAVSKTRRKADSDSADKDVDRPWVSGSLVRIRKRTLVEPLEKGHGRGLSMSGHRRVPDGGVISATRRFGGSDLVGSCYG